MRLNDSLRKSMRSRVSQNLIACIYSLAFLFFLITCFFLISCQKQAEINPTLAQVGERSISQKAYEHRLRKFLMLTPVDDARTREALLQTLIDEQVLLQEAEQRGLREHEDFKHYAQSSHTDAVLEVYRDQIADARTVVSEQDLQEAFTLMNENAAARHLLAPSREQADALYEQLQAGATFEALAPQVFKDQRLADSGGYLGYFKWEDMDPTFAATAQKLKVGEISAPVRTKFGYSIIKLEDRQPAPLLTETEYAKMRKKLNWVVTHRKRAAAIQQLDQETLAQLDIRFNEDTIARMWEYRGVETNGSAGGQEEGAALLVIAPETVVATVKGKPFTFGELQERAQWTSERQRQRIQSREELKDFVSGLILRDEYLQRARAAGAEKDEKVKHLTREREDEFLMKKMVSLLTDTVTVPRDSLRQVYDAQPQQFTHPAQVHAREITVASREQCKQILREVKAGGDFAALAKSHSLRKWTAQRGGDAGFVTKGDLGNFAEDIFKLKPGEIAGPLQDGEYFTLVQVLEVKPQRQKTFEEAGPEIRALLLPLYRQHELQAQLARLREAMSIDIKQKVYQRIASPF